MPTSYESRVNALKVSSYRSPAFQTCHTFPCLLPFIASLVSPLQDAILAALQEDSDPSAAALSILKAASPSSLTHAGGIASLAKPPSASDGVLLYNAVLAAVLHLAGQAAEKKEHVMSLSLGTGDQPTVAHLLDSALWLAGQSPPMLDAGAPAACIEAIVEVCTNAECDGVFAYLDSRLVQFKRPGVMVKSHHTLLRTCNLLLKRLSKSQDAPLCGRVLMFLAKFLPLTERSGVNLTGAFHTENVTPMEDVPEGALDAEGRPVDATFYKTFWGLQQWFADPPAVLAKGKWPEVSRGVRAVLDRFAAVKVTVTEAPPGASLLGAGAGAGASVKYLSSARLLPLQLRDATFRRHFLIQCLVLMSWVERPLLKDWVAKAAKGKVLDDLQELQAAVYKALEATPEHGAEFTAAIRAMMAEENAWAVWKQAGCPAEPLQVAPLAPLPAVDIDDLAPPPKRPRPGPEAVYGVRVGPEELNRLWNLTEDNLSSELNMPLLCGH